jgi:hypothetical protein
MKQHRDKTMTPRVLRSALIAVLAFSTLLQPSATLADPVAVRHLEGLTHGFLVLQTLDGNTIADGDLTQVVKGDRVTDHLVFRFKDGSLSDETWVFTQRGVFRLLTDHLLQKGPAFKQPMETSLDTSTGQVKVRYTDADGKEKVLNERLKLPPNLANGMIPILLKNIQPSAPPTTVSYLAATPKPRIVKLAIASAGEEPFSTAGTSRKATRYIVKVEIGGAAGLLAPLLGQQPPDTSVWILPGEAPSFLKSEGPLYQGGPIWRTELVSPVWPQSPPQNRTK